MAEVIPQIRNAVRALIIEDDHVLLLKKDGYETGGVRYALPGGGQDAGECLEDTLQRECLEEIGTAIRIGDLIAVADFLKLRDTTPVTRRHVMEFLFLCQVPESYRARSGPEPDKHQVDVVWMPMDNLPTIQLFPQYLSSCIPEYRNPERPIYLGCFKYEGFPA